MSICTQLEFGATMPKPTRPRRKQIRKAPAVASSSSSSSLPPWERESSSAADQNAHESNEEEMADDSDASEKVSDKVRYQRRMAAMERGGESESESDSDEAGNKSDGSADSYESNGKGGDGYYDDDDDDGDNGDEDNEDEEQDGETSKRMELLNSLRELSFGQLQKLKSTGLNGIPLHKALGFSNAAQINAWVAGDDSVLNELHGGKSDMATEDSDDDDSDDSDNEDAGSKRRAGKGRGSKHASYAKDDEEEKQPRKKRSKHEPQEVSSKRQVTRFRESVQVVTNKVRDPRFESLAGQLNTDMWKKAYSFIDDYREDEIGVLVKKLKNDKDMRAKGKRRFKGKLNEEEKYEIQAELTRMQQIRAKQQHETAVQKVKSARAKTERAKVASGAKQPFYLKRKDVKQMELQVKFDRLKKSGKLKQYQEKRRKRNAAKDHRHMPSERIID